MSATPVVSIYESKFAKSDKTDAILVVEGKKLHVNKALLSYHSDYFNTLFNGEFKEKSMPEISIDDVKFEDFATLLSLVQAKPICPKKENAEKILELADRFLLPTVKFPLDLFLANSYMDRYDKVRIGDKYEMKKVFDQGISEFTEDDRFYNMKSNSRYQSLSDKVKVAVLSRVLSLKN
ncbi:hypothetical protein CRE_19766 [Caenorhabditis remanei]|uniref:BTB domain-containing protein n=1 Tax=Caenorhabditis remanei TaxID=31234 RepID=E3MTP5_CAERE|nr:hypothetical protein CRE_19766 [Caenorhabditis remanei]